MKTTTIAYSKSTRDNHIDIRGRVDTDANTISCGDGGSNQSTQNFVAVLDEVKKCAAIARPNAELGYTVKANGDIRPHRLDEKKGGVAELQINFEENVSATVLASHAPKTYTASDIRIRKLTPVECERLQGFPDQWTKFGKKENGTTYEISNSQRYKMCGNAVSAPVAATILTTLIPEGEVRVQSLFSGILGTELNLPDRFKLTGTCEFDKYASDVIRFHKTSVPNFHDVTKFVDRNDVPDFDLLTFGFPCQSFSIAGLRQGFDDKKGRGSLIYNVFDIIEKHKPKYFMAENVKGLLNHNNGTTFIEILKGLSGLGYEIDFELVNSKHFRLAQNRERVFIFGRLK